MTRNAKGIMYYSQWRLIWLKFKSHRIALVSACVLLGIYLSVIFSQFLAPYDPTERHTDRTNAPPQPIHWTEDGRLQRPFVYGYHRVRNANTLAWDYTADTNIKLPILFFVQGQPYRLWGLFPTKLHLYGVAQGGTIHLLGTDYLGRDTVSRLLYGGQISLSIGLVGVTMSLLIGMILGGLSGYLGGVVDMLVQRLIEFLICIPTLPLWMGLAAAVPATWPVTHVYLMMCVILSLVSWTGLARVVRGKILSGREETYVLASQLGGAGTGWILRRHLLPGLTSYVIVALTLSVPAMILAETALSFLGLGLQPPAISWGVLLQSAQNLRTIALYPWLLSPAILVIAVVLCFNFVGDGLRDAADPYVR